METCLRARFTALHSGLGAGPDEGPAYRISVINSRFHCAVGIAAEIGSGQAANGKTVDPYDLVVRCK